jgi:mannitol-specific phosphotransferase system IIBC component
MRNREAAECGVAFACGVAGVFLVGVPTFFMALLGSPGPVLAVQLIGPAGAFVGFVAGVLLSQLRLRK